MSGISVACFEHLRFWSALIDAQFPWSVGILVCMFVMSFEHRRMFFSKVLPSMVLMKWVESEMYEGGNITACLSQ